MMSTHTRHKIVKMTVITVLAKPGKMGGHVHSTVRMLPIV